MNTDILKGILNHYIEIRELNEAEHDDDGEGSPLLNGAKAILDQMGDHTETMNGQPVHQSDDGKTLWIPIPKWMAKPIDGGCCCEYCKAHPDKPGHMDTICIAAKPGRNGQHTSTVHFPELTRKASLHGWPTKPEWPKYRTVQHHAPTEVIDVEYNRIKVKAGQTTVEVKVRASDKWVTQCPPFEYEADAIAHAKRCKDLDNL